MPIKRSIKGKNQAVIFAKLKFLLNAFKESSLKYEFILIFKLYVFMIEIPLKFS